MQNPKIKFIKPSDYEMSRFTTPPPPNSRGSTTALLHNSYIFLQGYLISFGMCTMAYSMAYDRNNHFPNKNALEFCCLESIHKQLGIWVSFPSIFFPYTLTLESVVLNCGIIYHSRDNGGHSDDIMVIPKRPYTVYV
jgi:hypothetical protein